MFDSALYHQNTNKGMTIGREVFHPYKRVLETCRMHFEAVLAACGSQCIIKTFYIAFSFNLSPSVFEMQHSLMLFITFNTFPVTTCQKVGCEKGLLVKSIRTLQNVHVRHTLFSFFFGETASNVCTDHTVT